jgi:hypothetical protein
MRGEPEAGLPRRGCSMMSSVSTPPRMRHTERIPWASCDSTNLKFQFVEFVHGGTMADSRPCVGLQRGRASMLPPSTRTRCSTRSTASATTRSGETNKLRSSGRAALEPDSIEEEEGGKGGLESVVEEEGEQIWPRTSRQRHKMEREEGEGAGQH